MKMDSISKNSLHNNFGNKSVPNFLSKNLLTFKQIQQDVLRGLKVESIFNNYFIDYLRKRITCLICIDSEIIPN